MTFHVPSSPREVCSAHFIGTCGSEPSEALPSPWRGTHLSGSFQSLCPFRLQGSRRGTGSSLSRGRNSVGTSLEWPLVPAENQPWLLSAAPAIAVTGIHQQSEETPAEGEETVSNDSSDKGLMSRIYKELKHLPFRKANGLNA